ncbi:hypothetical protein K3495_g1477 [Podosphaera aphanis]|nr:hypothetical protein K3495_g1477 [Podosphaera aphanis]
MTMITRSDTSMIAYYPSLETATQAEKAFANQNGYCLKIQRTHTVGNKTGAQPKNRTLTCVHGGRPPTGVRARSTASRRDNCPFQLRLARSHEGDSNIWSSVITHPEHNHDAASDIAAYPAARALRDSEVETVHRLSSIGAKPRVIIDALREQNPANRSTTQDIYNLKKSRKRKLLRLDAPVAVDVPLPPANDEPGDDTGPQAAAEPLDWDDLFKQLRHRYNTLLPNQRPRLLHSLRNVLDQNFDAPKPLMASARSPGRSNPSSCETGEQLEVQRQLHQQ